MEAKISSRLIAGTIVMIREGVAMAVPAAEQIGQTRESTELELRSTQQCNCAPRNTTPMSKARMETRFVLTGIKPEFSL